jgi:hypothetical protein
MADAQTPVLVTDATRFRVAGVTKTDGGAR